MTDAQQLANALHDNPRFMEFEEYVLQEVEKIKSLDGLEDLDNDRAGEEAKVRLKAVRAIEKILSPFIKFTEKSEPSKEDYRKAQRKAGLE